VSEIGDRIIAADCAPPRTCGAGWHSTETTLPRLSKEDAATLQRAMTPVPDPDETTKFSTGAVRSADRVGQRYDLISPIGLRQLAETCHEGAEKYSDFNWEKGMPVHDLLNHAVAHIYAYLSGDRSEPHLAHGAWNLFAAMHSEELWPELNKGNLREPGCKPPTKG
jgi:hypothetical protein